DAGVEQLDGDAAVELWIVGVINDAHPAGAEPREHDEAAEAGQRLRGAEQLELDATLVDALEQIRPFTGHVAHPNSKSRRGYRPGCARTTSRVARERPREKKVHARRSSAGRSTLVGSQPRCLTPPTD